MPALPGYKLSLVGFTLSQRRGHFDWRLLHGIDIESVVRLTDVGAIEDALDTLQNGTMVGECPSIKSCIQLFRLLQLAIEYLWHLRNAHVTLLERYQSAAGIAERWAAAARAYLDAGHAFLGSCLQTGDIERLAVQGIDRARRALEEQDGQYNAALDKLEDEDQRARYFHFRKQRAEMQWQLIHSVDLDDLAARMDASTLDKVLPNLVYGSIMSEDCDELTTHHFGHLIPLAQAGLDYMMFQANSTGAALEQAMAGLQSACTDIPALTAATQDLHVRITEFLRDTRQHAMQLSVLGSPVRLLPQPPLQSPVHMHQQLIRRSQLRSPLHQQQQYLPQQPQLAYPLGASPLQQAQLVLPPQPPLPLLHDHALHASLSAGDVLQQHQQGILAPAHPLGASSQPTFLGPSPSLGTSITGGLAVGPTGMPLGASPEELSALSQLGVPLQALGVYQQASHLNAGMDGLEHDLRLERVRMEEMRQLVRSLKGSVRMSVEGPQVLESASGAGAAATAAAAPPGQARRRKSGSPAHRRTKSNASNADAGAAPPQLKRGSSVFEVQEPLSGAGSMDDHQMQPGRLHLHSDGLQQPLQPSTSSPVEDHKAQRSWSSVQEFSLAGSSSLNEHTSAPPAAADHKPKIKTEQHPEECVSSHTGSQASNTTSHAFAGMQRSTG